MEGYERNLEAHAGDEEHEAEDAEQRAVEQGTDLVKVERTRGTVDEGDAVEQEGAGEEGQEDELRAGFGTLHAAFVEGHQCCHGHGSQFEADEEHQEVAA